MSDNDFKLVFGMTIDATDNVPFIVIGIPRQAWEYMKDGKTHHFDLSSAGVPVRLMLFGAETHDAAVELIKRGIEEGGSTVVDRRDKDFSIKPPKVN